MTHKIGDLWYSVNVNDDGSIEWDHWITRTIRGDRVYAIYKCESTWGKRSTKIGDFGWLDPIDPVFRRSWRVTEKPPKWLMFSRTKLGAIFQALTYYRDPETVNDFDNPTFRDKIVVKLQMMQKREHNRR